MNAQVLRVVNDKCVILHIPGQGSVIKVHLKDTLDEMPRASCISPYNPVQCVMRLGYYNDGSFYDSEINIQWVQQKKQRTQYKIKK